MSYYFGVEIEVIAEPQRVQDPLLRRVYYERLARALNRHGLSAAADKLDGSRYCKHAEYYDSRWWITKDGSLKDPSYPRIPLEAVSPILWTAVTWEAEVDTFWRAWRDVFHTPDASSLCGSHIHVSPYPRKTFSLTQLKDIAIGIIFYEPLIHQLLPECRQNNKYCRRNTLRSTQLQNMGSDDGHELREVCRYILQEIDDVGELRDFMQENASTRKDRYVLWNFDNILPGESGSIEFRGGHGLRGPQETRKWIAFVVSVIHLCIERRYDNWGARINDFFFGSFPRPSMRRFWRDLARAARFLNVRQHLPSEYYEMIFSQDCSEEFEGYDDDSSIVSKDDSKFSDSYDEDSDGRHSHDYYSD
ncbi:putative amidoligase enzyme-domain-containing protein [Xylaria telfairii]|nr:putative amidoligase enzyme-domain-containing protein [Xylaria telfairii]